MQMKLGMKFDQIVQPHEPGARLRSLASKDQMGHLQQIPAKNEGRGKNNSREIKLERERERERLNDDAIKKSHCQFSDC
jgi:hypothetical protein